MVELFLKLLNMSITASWLVLAAIVLRVILKKAPKWIRCLLWAFVAVRLICPFSLESVFSLIPSTETVPQDIMYAQEPAIHTGLSAINSVVNPVLSQNFAPIPENSVNPMQVVTIIAANIWLVGLLVMIIYAAGSFFRIHRKVAVSMRFTGNMYLCDYIETPFILGVMKPKIYIPSTLEEKNMTYVIAHEKAHVKRHDHWWKPLGFALLAVYWFNPVMWVAYVLLCRDIELACDEKVIRELGEMEKKSYSNALLSCSIPRKMIVACPLAFGEVGVKERVRTVLNYKKPALWIMVVAVLVCVAVAICFLTNPKEENGDSGETYQFVEAAEKDSTSSEQITPLEQAIHDAILGKDKGKEVKNVLFPCESHVILGTEETYGETTAESGAVKHYVTVYAMVLKQSYVFKEPNGKILDDGGSHMPVAITFEVTWDEKYSLVEYWMPMDGSYYMTSIREKFPDDIEEDALDTQKYILAQIQDCYEQAVVFGSVDTDAVIDELFEEIESSPADAANPAAYIDAHSLENRELTYYGDYTLRYIFSKFLEGGQTGLRGQLMRIVLDEMAPEHQLRLYAKTGQEYFDVWLEKAQELYTKKGEAWMAENQPAAWLCLEMMDSGMPD